MSNKLFEVGSYHGAGETHSLSAPNSRVYDG
jgi:hypothetical protein